MKDVTTAFVRRHYSKGPTAYRQDGSIAKMPSAEDVEYAGEQFDLWLARHDRDVQAEALENFRTSIRDAFYGSTIWLKLNAAIELLKAAQS